MPPYTTKPAIGDDTQTLLMKGGKLYAVFVGDDHQADAAVVADLLSDEVKALLTAEDEAVLKEIEADPGTFVKRVVDAIWKDAPA